MDEQRIAIITGGASGISKDLAIQLANKDIFVVIAILMKQVVKTL